MGMPENPPGKLDTAEMVEVRYISLPPMVPVSVFRLPNQ
jgi:hypothetical protein